MKTWILMPDILLLCLLKSSIAHITLLVSQFEGGEGHNPKVLNFCRGKKKILISSCNWMTKHTNMVQVGGQWRNGTWLSCKSRIFSLDWQFRAVQQQILKILIRIGKTEKYKNTWNKNSSQCVCVCQSSINAHIFPPLNWLRAASYKCWGK